MGSWAHARTTIGAQRLVDHLADRGVRLSAFGVQKILRRHRLGRRAQRVAALAQSSLPRPPASSPATPSKARSGFCHFAARPGDLGALDTFQELVEFSAPLGEPPHTNHITLRSTSGVPSLVTPR